MAASMSIRTSIPRRTALVVVDMQNAFMLPGVAHAPCLPAQGIVDNINRLAEAVRATGGTVVWIKTTYTDASLQDWSVLYDMLGRRKRGTPRQGADRRQRRPCPVATLDVQAEDLMVEKNRYSAFIQGSSDLEKVLRDRGLDTLLITGTVTNVCCESTARDAMMLNFKTVMVSDGNAAVTDEDHRGSLVAILPDFRRCDDHRFRDPVPRTKCTQGGRCGGIGRACPFPCVA